MELIDFLNANNVNYQYISGNLTVGDWLDLSGTGIKNKEKERKKIKRPAYDVKLSLKLDLKLSWQNGRYRKIDSIFCEVIRQLKGALKVKVGSEIKYIVTDGTFFSHGSTIKEAKRDLIYKISERDTSKYRNMTLDTVLTKEDAIKMYRVVAGACEAGTKHFVTNLPKVKSKYSIRELINLTKGQYGADKFSNFFKHEELNHE